MQKIDQLNYLSIELLEQLGNKQPSQAQIDLIESILSSSAVNIKVSFSNKLTQREVTCLYWAAHGMTTQKTASLLNISSSTVESHRKEIKRKLKCMTIAQAVFQGIFGGYLNKNCCLSPSKNSASNNQDIIRK